MGASKEQFNEERENFFTRLEDNEEYATVSMRMYMLDRLNGYGKDIDYTIHDIKQNKSTLKK